MTKKIAIVGGGFSGAMLAARLAESGLASSLINRSADFGLGVAYSTRADVHLLNVRSHRMSAVLGDPDHFVRWLRAHHPDHADPQGFAPRKLYGHYVQARLAAVEQAHPGRIERIVGAVQSILPTGARLDDGRTVTADAVVLATGNPAPATLAKDDAQPSSMIPDPWADGALDGVRSSDDLVIVGTGLTMVDMIMSLKSRGWNGHAVAVSRRGLTPRAHGAPASLSVAVDGLSQGRLSDRLKAARALAEATDWHALMEGLRPVTASAWIVADAGERARFLRHLRPWWDVHRHRIAPSIAAELDQLRSTGRLEVRAGKIADVTPSGSGVSVRWRARGEQLEQTLTADRLIDCSGPGYAPQREVPTAELVRTGAARLHPSGLGLDIDAQGRLFDIDGRASARLYVLGPPARAAFWETVAVPDIRDRIEDLVEALRT